MHGFIRHIDATLGQQVFNIPKAQRKPEILPNGVLDDIGWKPVAAIEGGVRRRLVKHQLNPES
jgi:hypothetical protein